MIIHDLSSDDYITKLKGGEKFSFSRWGDGEWICANGGHGAANADGHQYFAELTQGLLNALKSDHQYYRAIWPSHHGQISSNMTTILKVLSDWNINIEWANAIVWEDLVLREGIQKMVDQLRSMYFVMVSDSSKKNLNVGYKNYIEIPARNCFLEKDRIKDDMVNIINTISRDDIVFGLSCSMTTNVIIDELYPFIGNQCWMIDFGSIWEPFVGKITRSYHREYISNDIR